MLCGAKWEDERSKLVERKVSGTRAHVCVPSNSTASKQCGGSCNKKDEEKMVCVHSEISLCSYRYSCGGEQTHILDLLLPVLPADLVLVHTVSRVIIRHRCWWCWCFK